MGIDHKESGNTILYLQTMEAVFCSLGSSSTLQTFSKNNGNKACTCEACTRTTNSSV